MDSDEQQEHAVPLDDVQVIRRQDLVDLGDSFVQALAPVSVLVEYQQEAVREMQKLSHAAEHQAAATRRQSYAVWGIIFLALLVLGVLYRVADKLNQQSRRMDAIHENMNSNVKLLKELATAARDTNESVTAAEERAATQPTMQLLPELDPEKAKKTPLRLQITGPSQVPEESIPPGIMVLSPSTEAPRGATIEIPISAESF